MIWTFGILFHRFVDFDDIFKRRQVASITSLLRLCSKKNWLGLALNLEPKPSVVKNLKIKKLYNPKIMQV